VTKKESRVSTEGLRIIYEASPNPNIPMKSTPYINISILLIIRAITLPDSRK